MRDIDDMLGMDENTAVAVISVVKQIIDFTTVIITRIRYSLFVWCLVQHAETHIVKHMTSSTGSGFD